MTDEKKTQLAIVGAGPGGYAAAFLAADLGMEVTLIDREPNPGGVCLYRGCIPSKALLHAAKVIREAGNAKAFGVKFGAPEIDIDALRAWKDGIVEKLTGGLGQLGKQRKVRFIQGSAKFLGPTELEITLESGNIERLGFENAIIATGSKPFVPPALALDSPRVMDSTAALELADVPKRLLAIGGGFIGLELSAVYAALGSRVTVVEMTGSLIPGVDKDLARPLLKRLEEDFEAIHLDTKVATLVETAEGVKATFEGENLEAAEQEFDKVLVSVGRKANFEGLGLENTKAAVGPSGFIETNAALQTAEPSIYAIGDAAGQPLLAHKATREGRTAVEAIAGHSDAAMPRIVPAVVFTNPEIAWCGLTESQAREKNQKVTVTRFPWGASGRALTFGADDGLTKLVMDPESGKILGAGIVGTGAGELIAECALAVELGLTAADLKTAIHPHPTLSETIMESAEIFFGQATHIYKPKRK